MIHSKASRQAVLGALVCYLAFEGQVFAIFNPADTAALTAIATNTAATLSVLKTAASLLELSSDLRDTVGDAREDADAMQELMEEISPDPESVEYRSKYAEMTQDQGTLRDVNNVLLDTDNVKWEAQYLQERAKRSQPKRLAPLARLTTRTVRLGKKIAKLINGSAQEKTAYNTDVTATNSMVSAKLIADIRNLLTDMRDQQARDRLKAILNTAEFLYAVTPDFDAEIKKREERHSRL